jgi:hypothetical protein
MYRIAESPFDAMFPLCSTLCCRKAVFSCDVLVARTDKGDMVLDSRTTAIARWSQVRYRWISAQSMAAPMHWYAAAGTGDERLS